jgi:hypothetical protein
LTKKDPRKKKKPVKKPKGWQFPAQQPDEEEEEDPITEDNSNPQAPPTSEGINQEGMVAARSQNPDAEGNLDQEMQKEKEIGGSKRPYSSESSDSDKEHLRKTIDNQLIIVMSTPDQGGWRKVEKKKGRKG